MTFDTSSIVGLVVWILCILYSSLRSASRVAGIPDVEKQGNFLFCFLSNIPKPVVKQVRFLLKRLLVRTVWDLKVFEFFETKSLNSILTY